jgi:hypothetical protein
VARMRGEGEIGAVLRGVGTHGGEGAGGVTGAGVENEKVRHRKIGLGADCTDGTDKK